MEEESETVGQRLKRLRSAKGWSQARLAKEAGLKSQGAVGNIESGIRGYGESIVDIAKALETTPDYLRLAPENEPKRTTNARGITFDQLSPVTIRRKVPLISWVQAGCFREVVDMFEPGQADEWVDAIESAPSGGAFALKVDGESMLSQVPGDVTFPPGSIIIVDPQVPASAGDFVIAKDIATQKATFKKLVYDGGRWFLRPLNPIFPTMEIDDPSIRVIGKVVELVLRRKL
jgi:SOS-response transcriptional repressor LexA